ncbi:hypothetical protein AB836_00005 [Rickettsiales bacterium (ex Bugula neritina AB1)]|nr:hypothetical protein AB836_00005 [Rickettsiales bacterium (ex Bugula neritina AB1)]
MNIKNFLLIITFFTVDCMDHEIKQPLTEEEKDKKDNIIERNKENLTNALKEDFSEEEIKTADKEKIKEVAELISKIESLSGYGYSLPEYVMGLIIEQTKEINELLGKKNLNLQEFLNNLEVYLNFIKDFNKEEYQDITLKALYALNLSFLDYEETIKELDTFSRLLTLERVIDKIKHQYLEYKNGEIILKEKELNNLNNDKITSFIKDVFNTFIKDNIIGLKGLKIERKNININININYFVIGIVVVYLIYYIFIKNNTIAKYTENLKDALKEAYIIYKRCI